MSGPPSTYTREVGDVILERLAAGGQGLKGICRDDPALPDESTVRLWALNNIDGFGERFSRAREISYHSMADEIFEIADDARNDWIERHNDKTGVTDEVPNHEHINRSRLRVDTRKWFLAKVLPKIYGDKVALTGHNGGAVEVENVTTIELIGLKPAPPPPC